MLFIRAPRNAGHVQFPGDIQPGHSGSGNRTPSFTSKVRHFSHSAPWPIGYSSKEIDYNYINWQIIKNEHIFMEQALRNDIENSHSISVMGYFSYLNCGLCRHFFWYRLYNVCKKTYYLSVYISAMMHSTVVISCKYSQREGKEKKRKKSVLFKRYNKEKQI